jgi:hypothetical protein
VKPRVSNSTVFALCVLACVAPGLPLAAAEPSAAPPDFAWLAGNWLSCRADGYVEERWLGPSRGSHRPPTAPTRSTRSQAGGRRSSSGW